MAGEKVIAGKTFLLTGGASGLGALYAEKFLKEGAKKVALVDIAEDLGKATTARLNGSHPNKVIFFKCDVSNEQDIAATFDKVVVEFGRVDVLINNAGIMNDSAGAWRKACDVNWQGLVSFTMKGLKHMSKDEGGAGGTIINISSVAATLKFKELPIYAGSKMAGLHFSKSLAMDPFHGQTGVRILILCPGPTTTPLMGGLEAKSYSAKVGAELAASHQQLVAAVPGHEQTTDNVVTACLTIFKEGGNGSVWIVAQGKPARDVTKDIDDVYQKLQEITFAL